MPHGAELLGLVVSLPSLCAIVTVEGFRQFREQFWRYGRPVLMHVAVPLTLLSWSVLLVMYFLLYSLRGSFEANVQSLSAVTFTSVACFFLAVNVVPLVVFLYSHQSQGGCRVCKHVASSLGTLDGMRRTNDDMTSVGWPGKCHRQLLAQIRTPYPSSSTAVSVSVVVCH